MGRPFTFTEARIRGIPTPEAGRVYYSDAKTKGLKLAAYPTGARTFILYRKVQGRPERIFIGRWPETSVEAAIDKADEMNGAIAKGENPAELRRQVRLEGTFKSLWERLRWPRFCTAASERVYITARGCETGFAATRGL